MNAPHWHLLLNHFPIIGTIIGTGVMIAAMVSRNLIVRRTAYTIYAFTALVSIPAFLTGDPAHEAIEHLPGVSRHLMHEHEEAAELAIWAVVAMGLLAGVALFFSIKMDIPKVSQILEYAVLVFAIVTMVLMYRVGATGGEIRHPEIQTGTPAISPDYMPDHKEGHEH